MEGNLGIPFEEGVIEKVPQDKIQMGFIEMNPGQGIPQVGNDLSILLSRGLPLFPQKIFQYGVQVLDAGLGRRKLGKLQEVLKKGVDPPHILMDQTGKFLTELGVIILVGQKVSEGVDGHQWILDLMSQSGNGNIEPGIFFLRGRGSPKWGHAGGTEGQVLGFYEIPLLKDGRPEDQAFQFRQISGPVMHPQGLEGPGRKNLALPSFPGFLPQNFLNHPGEFFPPFPERR
jgi:hypothetical protein